jgi:hypothetical protein
MEHINYLITLDYYYMRDTSSIKNQNMYNYKLKLINIPFILFYDYFTNLYDNLYILVLKYYLGLCLIHNKLNLN